MKLYLASPWFNEEQARIRDEMYTHILKESYFNIFRPDRTESSIEYGKAPSIELGSKIFDENIEHILDSSHLIFPSKTTDVGTLFEIGVAIKTDKIIFRYDYEEKNIKVLDEKSLKSIGLFEFSGPTLVQIESPSSAILLGYNYDCKYDMYYVLGEGIEDNLMLRFLAKRVKFVSEKKVFEVQEYDIKEAL